MNGEIMDKLVVQICIRDGNLLVHVFLEIPDTKELALLEDYQKVVESCDWESIVPILESHFDPSRKLIEIRLCDELGFLRGEVTPIEKPYGKSLLRNYGTGKIILTPNLHV